MQAMYAADEMITVTAVRLVADGVCFAGIGLPILAANLARHTHAPNCVLIYESGTVGSKPNQSPLSGRTVEEVRDATGWPLRVAADLQDVKPPSDEELDALRLLTAMVPA